MIVAANALARPIDAVVVVGPSGAGKTTLVDAIRAANLPGVDIPVRYVTRPPRAGDGPLETIHLSPEQFDEGVRGGEIALHWVRMLEAGRKIRYGFRAPRPGALAVLSANSAILFPAAELDPADALARALVVGVAAPPHVCKARLARRSPDLRPEELAHRLAHGRDPEVDVTIANHGALETVAKAEIVELIGRLVALRA